MGKQRNNTESDMFPRKYSYMNVSIMVHNNLLLAIN